MSLDKSKALFQYHQKSLHFNGHDLSQTAAIKNYCSPVLIHDLKIVQERLNWLKEWKGLSRLYFAMKSNYDEKILTLIRENKAGVDVVSLGEIKWALKQGFTPQDILFSGVGKTKEEITWAIENEIYQLNVESLPELIRVGQISQQLKKYVQVGLRINPEIDAKTHPYIATALIDSKFGLNTVDFSQIKTVLDASPFIKLAALSFHIGSQIMDAEIFREAIQKMKPIFRDFKQRYPSMNCFDLGGGIGLDYKKHDMNQDYKTWSEFRQTCTEALKDIEAEVVIEFGRFIVARSSVLVGQVQYIKKTVNKSIAILDVGMNNLIRPMLYQSYHHIYPLVSRAQKQNYLVVGPLCESSDQFHEDVTLTELQEGDFVAIADAGAYAKSMASNYNLQPIAVDTYL